MKLAADVSMKGQTITDPNKLANLFRGYYEKGISDGFVERIVNLPHASLQKFSDITVMFLGVSRRFLAQITRHQDVAFMSSSFRQADHGADAGFCIPIEVIRAGTIAEREYRTACNVDLTYYKTWTRDVGRDAAAYLLPQATRCTILAKASMFQWKHIISQRTCNKAMPEMRYVMLRLWDMLYDRDPQVFSPATTGSDCMQRVGCREGDRCCGNPLSGTPAEILERDFPELIQEPEDER
jgi:thymidylate synthase (FAD)